LPVAIVVEPIADLLGRDTPVRVDHVSGRRAIWLPRIWDGGRLFVDVARVGVVDVIGLVGSVHVRVVDRGVHDVSDRACVDPVVDIPGLGCHTPTDVEIADAPDGALVCAVARDGFAKVEEASGQPQKQGTGRAQTRESHGETSH
jgi:hypothetical protein